MPMKYQLILKDSVQTNNILAALQIVDPGAEIIGQDPDVTISVRYTPDFHVHLQLSGRVEGDWEIHDREIADPRYNMEDQKQRLKELIRLGVITLLGESLGKEPPWGILSGVRPTKIFHYLRDKGFSTAEIREILLRIYGLKPVKADLLLEIGSRQERFLALPAQGLPVGIYIGIPFCPTRCRYCSFPAVSLETHRHLIPRFLTALETEISGVARLCHEFGMVPETIYIGGGTPTSLDEPSFLRLMKQISRHLHTPSVLEFTVEAGRPETISLPKLQAMADAGVTRVCINPQTMQPSTLETIGRNHSVEMVYEAAALVRQFPAFDLNMDLILGLPGEDVPVFLQSLDAVLRLKPENITLHTLAPKRAAAWRKGFSELNLVADQHLVRATDEAAQYLREQGYQPYYLYRQRYILADQENTGFALPDKECIYNIHMMEERRTILGLGGGSVTKWVDSHLHIYRDQNPGCPATYASRVEEQIDRKFALTGKNLFSND